MTTTWWNRASISSSWVGTRYGGSYLTDVNWVFITDVQWRRIVVKVLWGNLPFEKWNSRTII